jgi:hypothetical protein
MLMKFTDGMTIDTSGPLRVIYKRDGLYVVGNGTLCAVDSRAEGNQLIAEMRAIEEKYRAKATS